MSDGATKTLVHCLVISCLDYANSLLMPCSKTNIHRLQRIQNVAAKLVTRAGKFDHVTPLLLELHWLPVSFRITFKVLLLVHKCVLGEAPEYLIDLFESYVPNRNLRSGDKNLLVIHKTRTNFGLKAFMVHGAKMYNSLDVDLKSETKLQSFKGHLKTKLFKDAFY